MVDPLDDWVVQVGDVERKEVVVVAQVGAGAKEVEGEAVEEIEAGEGVAAEAAEGDRETEGETEAEVERLEEEEDKLSK